MRRFLVLFLILSFAAPAMAEVPPPKAKPPVPKTVAKKEQPATTATAVTTDGVPMDGDALPMHDVEEADLPDYPMGARIAAGKMKTYAVQEMDTFLDIARHFGLGYVELRAANPDVDPWAPVPGTELVIPTFNLLPRAPQRGIVVNLGKMKLYYFRAGGKPPLVYPIGIGREGLQTPTGETTIVRKTAGPSWFPTERMRKEKPALPASVPPGPSNPLGTHALYLGWPTFLIHGSNKPWGIGRRVSSGCMRMYPEDIIAFFNMVEPGTKVTVVDQPVLVGWVDDTLYLEANPTQTQSSDLEFGNPVAEKPMTPAMRATIEKAAGAAADRIDWRVAERVMKERRGYPVAIATLKGELPEALPSRAAKKESAPASSSPPPRARGGYAYN